MSIEELQTRCVYWQKVLRLQDWDITFHYKRINKLENEKSWAECERSKCFQKAHIYMLDPIDVPNMPHPEEYDEERALVHELVHVRFNITAKDDEYTQLEEAVERTALALIQLDKERNDH